VTDRYPVLEEMLHDAADRWSIDSEHELNRLLQAARPRAGRWARGSWSSNPRRLLTIAAALSIGILAVAVAVNSLHFASITGKPGATTSESTEPRVLGSDVLVFTSARGILVLYRGSTVPHRVVHSGSIGISVSREGQVAYTVGLSEGSGEISIRNLDGTPGAFSVQPVGADQFPAWSPNDKQIAFMDGKNLQVFDLGSRSVRRVTTAPGPCVDEFPTWSPDGTKIGFYRDCDAGRRSGIYEIDTDGGTLRRVLHSLRDGSHRAWPGTSIHGQPTGLSWSPDGASIAFEMADGSVWLVGAKLQQNQGDRGLPGLSMLVGLDPSGKTTLGEGSIDWSPSGMDLAFIRGGSVFVIDPSDRRLYPVKGTVGLDPSAISWTGP
jgi:hypothetical protein